MVSAEVLTKVVEEQSNWLLPKGNEISRDFLGQFKPAGNFVEIITGVRRCGKSTVLRQIIEGRYQHVSFLNWEDPRLVDFETSDYDKLMTIFPSNTEAYLFDEIQNAPHWESYVRLLHNQGKKVFVTGSNAELLSRELGTKLTGRNIQHEMFPFSFSEFSRFKKMNPNQSALRRYLLEGGLPEYLETEKVIVHQQLFKEVVIRDIGVRYGLRNIDQLMKVAVHLMSNVGKEFSYNKIKNLFEIGSPSTVSDYCNWLEQAYLFFYLPRFNWSPAKKLVSLKKVYAIDNGLAKANSLSVSDDSGRMLENAVFLELRRRGFDLYYFREKKECDFLVFKQGKCQQAIQVCEQLNGDTQKREFAGLIEAMESQKLEKGLIVTLEQKDRFVVDGFVIEVVPAVEFLMANAKS
jgi:predicted AAA+ superfamily ATPase